MDVLFLSKINFSVGIGSNKILQEMFFQKLRNFEYSIFM